MDMYPQMSFPSFEDEDKLDVEIHHVPLALYTVIPSLIQEMLKRGDEEVGAMFAKFPGKTLVVERSEGNHFFAYMSVEEEENND